LRQCPAGRPGRNSGRGGSAGGAARTFIAAAAAGSPLSRPNSCGTWLYRFRLTAPGRPADVTRLRLRLAGSVTAIAGSADGNAVAYNPGLCRSFSVLAGRITVLSLRTGRVASWPYAGPTADAIPGTLRYQPLSGSGNRLPQRAA
jgi:hypothetical protein